MSCCSSSGEILVIPREGNFALDDPELALEGVVSSWDEFFGLAAEEDVDGEMRERIHDLRSRPFVAAVPEERVGEQLERLREHPNVAAATRNWRVSLDSPLDDLRGAYVNPVEVWSFLERWRLRGAVPAAPEPEPVRVAIIDSGVDPSAVLCPGALDPQQIDAVALGSVLRTNPHDPIGHGSVVAAIVHQIAPTARLTSVRCFGAGAPALANVVYAILFGRLLRDPVDIFNLSLSVDYSVDECPECGYVPDPIDERRALRNLFEHLRTELDHRPLFVAAAGNEGGTVAIPAGLNGVFAVGSTGASTPTQPACDPAYDQVPAEFVLAPGGSPEAPITVPDGMRPRRPSFGTSFSTAVVSGVLAAILADSDWFGIPPGHDEMRRQAAWNTLSGIARRFPGYDPARHGIGVLG